MIKESVTDENLDILIKGLEEYKKEGVIDPWVLSDGTTVEPLDVLKELQELRVASEAWRLIAHDKKD